MVGIELQIRSLGKSKSHEGSNNKIIIEIKVKLRLCSVLKREVCDVIKHTAERRSDSRRMFHCSYITRHVLEGRNPSSN